MKCFPGAGVTLLKHAQHPVLPAPGRGLPAQLWLPLAVRPLFPSMRTTNGLALPAVSHSKKHPKYTWKRVFLCVNVESSVSIGLSDNIEHLWPQKKRISYLLLRVVVATPPSPKSQPR